MSMRTLLAATLILSVPVRAEVVKPTDEGFIAHHSVNIARDRPTVFAAMTARVGQWWNPAHSFSGDAGNMLIDTECFCERWGNNLVRHLDTVTWMENSKVILEGGLGPLKELGLCGTMIWSLTAGDAATTTVDWKYHVYGSSETDMAQLASAVDGVLKEQIGRLADYLKVLGSE